MFRKSTVNIFEDLNKDRMLLAFVLAYNDAFHIQTLLPNDFVVERGEPLFDFVLWKAAHYQINTYTE